MSDILERLTFRTGLFTGQRRYDNDLDCGVMTFSDGKCILGNTPTLTYCPVLWQTYKHLHKQDMILLEH